MFYTVKGGIDITGPPATTGPSRVLDVYILVLVGWRLRAG